MGKFYVAYGSNLNMKQMRYRCPTAKFVGSGVVEDYELQFKGALHGAHATIVPKEGACVPVGIWEIQKRDEKSLDIYEGYREGCRSYYNKDQITVKMVDGQRIQAMVYIMDCSMDFGNPAKGYYDTIYEGYENCGLDTAVLDQAVERSMDQAQIRMLQGEMRFV